jgi:hypothetical protein
VAACAPDAAAAAAASLDLHEGIGDPLGEKLVCKRWPEHLRLVNDVTGEAVRGRCRATNRCEYCARLFAVETSEMLLLDAMEDAPSLYVVLTARELLDRGECRDHLRQLRKALRRRWPDIRWAVLVEFQRRGALHLNLLVKGVPVEDAETLREAVCGVWCSRVDAEPWAQFAGAVNDGAGLVRYIALHFLKPAQAPPKGWRGHRYSAMRDYLVRPAKVMREEARQSLKLKRLIWRGLDPLIAELELAASTDAWSLRHIRFLAPSDKPRRAFSAFPLGQSPEATLAVGVRGALPTAAGATMPGPGR